MSNKSQNELKKMTINKNIQLVKLFFQILALLALLTFIGLVISIIIIYGLDATENPLFSEDRGGGYTAGIVGIPLFSIVVISSIIIAILNLRDDSIKGEEETSEFKIVKKEETS